MIYPRIVLIFLFVFVQSFSVYSQIPSFNNSSEPKAPGSEYYVGKDLGKPLVRVHLINGVKRPGVYHIPMQTDLAQVLSYAGGAVATSDLEEVTIRRSKLGKTEILNVDLEDLFKTTSSVPTLQHNDMIHIEQDLTTNNVLTWTSIISSIATIALTMVLIDNNTD